MAAFIGSQRDDHRIPATVACTALGVSRSWYYKWRGGTLPPSAERRRRLAGEIKRLSGLHGGKYGSPRITDDLREGGWRVSENTVAALMREQGLAARQKKKRKSTEDNFARAEQQKLRLLAPLGKNPATHRIHAPQRPRHLDRLPATARAVRRMRHHRGRADCKLRAQTVEPVFGQIKACMKMTAMSRRGFGACRSEWLLAATAHNLRKLHIHRHSA